MGRGDRLHGWTVRDVAVHLIASAQAQANPVEFARQAVTGRRLTAEIGGSHWVDGLNEAQLRARTDCTPAVLPDRWQHHSAAALKARRRMPAPVRALPLLPIGTALGVQIGRQPLSYLFDMGFTRDVWTHRLDIARATDVAPELTAEHDGRIVADIVAEWSRRHRQPYTLTLTGPAGGDFHAGDGGEPQRVDAVEFIRILSGRTEGPRDPRPQAPALTQPTTREDPPPCTPPRTPPPPTTRPSAPCCTVSSTRSSTGATWTARSPSWSRKTSSSTTRFPARAPAAPASATCSPGCSPASPICGGTSRRRSSRPTASPAAPSGPGPTRVSS